MTPGRRKSDRRKVRSRSRTGKESADEEKAVRIVLDSKVILVVYFLFFGTKNNIY